VDPNDSGDWVSYWRSGDQPLEAMHAHFRDHAYHRHSHETYSFGVTESGAQGFTCRGGRHVSAAGMVMAFNPDDPHDGHAAAGDGFTYRMIHIGPALLADTLGDITGQASSLPLFPVPVLRDAAFGRELRRLYSVLTKPDDPLAAAEQLSRVAALASRHAAFPDRVRPAPLRERDSTAAAERIRALLDGSYAERLTGGDVAAAARASRYAGYRAFYSRYGVSPSEYQRGLRLRAARRALAQGAPAAEVAAAAGFADQAHLTRWFRRCYGITPGAYQLAVARAR
jgi:AraC-like DNA-binding protein